MPALTPEQEMLQTAAIRAISGDPWWTVEDLSHIENGDLRLLAQDAAFIALAKPSAILAILAQLEAQEAPSKKPFAGPGEWFSVGILGAPMREYEQGKWESATWPSDVSKGAAKLDRLEAMINSAAAQPAQAVPDDSEILLAAMRRAVLPLAHAANAIQFYRPGYFDLDAAINAAVERRSGVPGEPGQ